ncbi:MAG: FapA family protein, partial [Bacillota bacterium]|nr:FapA family protein [Bacillota bacterium]
SIVQTYEMHEIKPEVDQDASVDFYDLRLINSVKAGEWLGERMDATDGTPGKTVKGGSVTPVKGKNYPILYDKSNIAEVYENKKTTLYSKINGAVSYVDGKISVSNHLEINGDVNFSTGNINFDGYVTIKGTVSDGFSVVATKDIEINSDLGLGNVKEIVSTKGSVYIRGGIASKKQTIIKAAKSVYTKFVDNTVITAGDSVHIGFYCINSFIEAKELVMDSMKGQIIGGNIRTEIRVSAPIIGSEMERKTIIEVTGFDKEAIKNELEKTFQKIVELKKEQQQLKLALTHLDGKGELNPFQRKEYNDQTERLYSIKDEIKELEEKRKNDSYYLKTHGNGEICIGKKIYPNCTLIIQKNFIEITSPVSSTTYYVQDNQIKQVT